MDELSTIKTLREVIFENYPVSFIILVLFAGGVLAGVWITKPRIIAQQERVAKLFDEIMRML